MKLTGEESTEKEKEKEKEAMKTLIDLLKMNLIYVHRWMNLSKKKRLMDSCERSLLLYIYISF